MEPLHQCWQENCPSFSTKTGIRAVSALPSISIISPEERNSLADYAWRIFFRRYHILGGQTVKFHMISNKFLNQSNSSSCHKGTEESTDADSIKMMKDQKGKKYGHCQTGEVERCLDPVVLFVQQFRQIARKISVGTIGIVENGFGISILPYMDIVRLHHHITAIPVQTSSWKSKFYIARRKYGIRTGQEEAFFQHWRK